MKTTLLIALTAAVVLSTSCNTFIGLGRDMGSGPQRKEAMNMAGQNEDGAGYEKLASRMDKLEERMNKIDEAISNMGKKTNAHEEVINSIAADREDRPTEGRYAVGRRLHVGAHQPNAQRAVQVERQRPGAAQHLEGDARQHPAFLDMSQE